MIDKNKECDIIADLLPLYVDKKTKEKTNSFVQKHLAGCENCRQAYIFMKDSFTDILIEKKDTKKKKTKWLKKIRLRFLLYGYILLLAVILLYCIFDFIMFL